MGRRSRSVAPPRPASCALPTETKMRRARTPPSAAGGSRTSATRRWKSKASAPSRGAAGTRAPCPAPAGGGDAVAVSAGWVAWRAGPALWVAPVVPGGFGSATRVAVGDVGRPALDTNTLLYDYFGRIAAIDLTTMQRTILRREA